MAHSSSRPIRLDSNDGARAYHSSVTGRASRGRRVRLHPARQVQQGPAGLTAGLPGQDRTVLREARDRGTAVAREVSCFHRQAGCLIGQGVAPEPALRQLDGLAPAPLAHRLTGQGAKRVLVLLKKFPAGRGDPLIELGSVPDREACQEPGNLGGERAFRLLRERASGSHGPHIESVGSAGRRNDRCQGCPLARRAGA